jgi:hypothetical protein
MKKPKRKPRKGEHVCNCYAYRFPHRFGGGNCTGSWIADETWEANYGCGNPCDNCNNLNEDYNGIKYCEVYQGQEEIKECPAYQEFVEYNEIKVY